MKNKLTAGMTLAKNTYGPYLIDVTNCNRRKVEIPNGGRCVVDVRDRLLLQERVQLGNILTFFSVDFFSG